MNNEPLLNGEPKPSCWSTRLKIGLALTVVVLVIAGVSIGLVLGPSHTNVPIDPLGLLVVEQGQSRLGLYDLDGNEITAVGLASTPHEIRIHPKRRLAFVAEFGIQDYDENIGTPGHSIAVVDLDRFLVRSRLYTGTHAAPHGLALRPPLFNTLYCNVESPSSSPAILVFDISSPSPVRSFNMTEFSTFPTVPRTHNLVFDSFGDYLYVQSSGNVLRMNPDTGKILATYSDSHIQGLAFSQDHTSLIVSTNTITFLDPQTFQVQRVFGDLNVQQLLYSIQTPDGKYLLCPAVWDSLLLILDVDSGRVLFRVVVGMDPVSVVASPDSTMAFVSAGRGSFVTRVNIKTGEASRLVDHPSMEPNSLALIKYPSVPARQTLRIGAVLALSGADSASARGLQLGYDFWCESVNREGGLLIGNQAYFVEMIYLDSGDNSFSITHLVNSLVTEKGAKIIFGPYGTDANVIVAKEVAALKVPMITPAGAGAAVFTAGAGYVFGLLPPAGGYLKPVIDKILEIHPTPKNFVMLSISDQGALADAADSVQYAISRGLKNRGASVVLPSSDFQYVNGVIQYSQAAILDDIILAIQTMDPLPDVVMVASHLPDATALASSVYERQLVLDAFALSVGPSLGQFVSTLGAKSRGIMGASPWIANASFVGTDRWGTPSQFAMQFQGRFNLAADYLSAGAAACGVVIENALRETNSLEVDAMKSALATLNIVTSYGNISFSKSGQNQGKTISPIQLVMDPTGKITTQDLNIAAPIAPVGAREPFAFTNQSLLGQYWFVKQNGDPALDVFGTMNFDGLGNFNGTMVMNNGTAYTSMWYGGLYSVFGDGTGRFFWSRATGEQLSSHIIVENHDRLLFTRLISHFDALDQGSRLQSRWIMKADDKATFNSTSMLGTYSIVAFNGEDNTQVYGLVSFDGKGRMWSKIFYNEAGNVTESLVSGEYTITPQGFAVLTTTFIDQGEDPLNGQMVVLESQGSEITQAYLSLSNLLGVVLTKRDSSLISRSVDIVIFGGGVGGLYTGWRIMNSHLRNQNVHLYEATDRLGGRLLSAPLNPNCPEALSELGGMRFRDGDSPTDKQDVLVKKVIAQLGIETTPFYMNAQSELADESDNPVWLRGFKTTRGALEQEIGQGRLPANLPYKFDENELKDCVLKPYTESSTTFSFNKTILKTGLSNVSCFDNSWLLYQNLTLGGVNLPAYQVSNDYADRSAGLSEEAMDFMSDFSGYDMRDTIGVAPITAAEWATEAGPELQVKKFRRPRLGMEEIPRRLGAEFARLAGSDHIHLNRQLVSIDRAGPNDPGKYCMKIRVTVTSACSKATTLTETIEVVCANRVFLDLPQAALQAVNFGSLDNSVWDSAVNSVIGTKPMKLYVSFPYAFWNNTYPTFKAGRFVTSNPMNQVFSWYPGTASNRGATCGTSTSQILQIYTAKATSWSALLDQATPNCPADTPVDKCNITCFPTSTFFKGTPVPLTLVQALMAQLSVLFGVPQSQIPEPEYIHFRLYEPNNLVTNTYGWHFWKAGAKFWETFKYMLEPFPNIHVVSSTYAFEEGWVEGALIVSEYALEEKVKVARPSWLSGTEYCNLHPYFNHTL